MSFVDIQFPTSISYGSYGGPAFSTDVIELNSGKEQRNANWSQSRAEYNVAMGVKTQSELDVLIAFFRARRGKAVGFRYKDWTDYSATGQLLGTGDGSTTVFQFIKEYSDGTYSVTRNIYKLVSGTVDIYLNSILQSSGFTVDYDNGKVTFTSAVSSGVKVYASFEFDVPVRFDTDKMAATIDSYNNNSWNNVPIVEIKLDD